MRVRYDDKPLNRDERRNLNKSSGRRLVLNAEPDIREEDIDSLLSRARETRTQTESVYSVTEMRILHMGWREAETILRAFCRSCKYCTDEMARLASWTISDVFAYNWTTLNDIGRSEENAEIVLWEREQAMQVLDTAGQFEGNPVDLRILLGRPQFHIDRSAPVVLHGEAMEAFDLDIPCAHQGFFFLPGQVFNDSKEDRVYSGLRLKPGEHRLCVIPVVVTMPIPEDYFDGDRTLGTRNKQVPRSMGLPRMRVLPPLVPGGMVNRYTALPYALLDFVNGCVTELHPEMALDRSERRRIQKKGHRIPDVKKIVLRKVQVGPPPDEPVLAPPRAEAGESDGEAGEESEQGERYQHSWEVARHIRRQRYGPGWCYEREIVIDTYKARVDLPDPDKKPRRVKEVKR